MERALAGAKNDREKVVVLQRKVTSLEQQLDWFKRQLFGRKSEKRLIEDTPEQPLLDGLVVGGAPQPKDEKETITYRRGKRRGEDCASVGGSSL